MQKYLALKNIYIYSKQDNFVKKIVKILNSINIDIPKFNIKNKYSYIKS